MLQRLALAGLLVSGVFAADGTFELRGHVSGAEGRPQSFEVVLFGVESPYSESGALDKKGDFRFGGLASGNYTVAVVRKNLGEVRRTVVVSPAVADKHGIVKTSVPYSVEEAAANASGAMVSVRQLSVPETATDKYAESKKHLAERNVEAAVRCLKEAVEIAPQYSPAWNALGVISFQTGDNREAERYFRKALEVEPTAFEPILNLGALLLKNGANQEALEYNQRAAHDRPQDALANSQLGMNYFQLGDFERAEQYLTVAARLDPALFTQPQLFLAEIHARRGDRKTAILELKELLARRPDGPMAAGIRRDLEKLTDH